MLSYQIDFQIEKGQMNIFLVGSKGIFKKLYELIELLAKAIDVYIDVTHKMVELENSKISYRLDVKIEYPTQNLLGGALDSSQIDKWLGEGISMIFDSTASTILAEGLSSLSKELGLTRNFTFVEITIEKLGTTLEDFRISSILLFERLEYIKR